MASNLNRAALIAFAYVIWSSWGVFIRDLELGAHLITFYVSVVACAATLWLRPASTVWSCSAAISILPI